MPWIKYAQNIWAHLHVEWALVRESCRVDDLMLAASFCLNGSAHWHHVDVYCHRHRHHRRRRRRGRRCRCCDLPNIFVFLKMLAPWSQREIKTIALKKHIYTIYNRSWVAKIKKGKFILIIMKINSKSIFVKSFREFVCRFT